MNNIGKKERDTQNRVIALFKNELGYRYLGNWEDRAGNSNIEAAILTEWLQRQGYSHALIDRALYTLGKIAGDQSQSLYDVNKAVYSLLRYGVNVQPDTGQHKETVHLIDWNNPLNNDFAIAEEVSITGVHTKRPDIVVYLNGIAVGVLELKRSSVSVSEGIRQNLDNQKHIFIKPFFATIQYIMAGNDFEGLRYGAIDPGTNTEKSFLTWKEANLRPGDQSLGSIPKDAKAPSESGSRLQPASSFSRAIDGSAAYPLDQHLVQLLNKERFLELLHDFIVYDRGTKKLCRHNQYFGVKAAQDFIKRREGGILWHSQGSGKSLTMVWLTKWIREYNPDGRVLILTDREELDEQIEKVYSGVDEQIHRTSSGRELLRLLNDTSPWLICSLIHKFGGKEEGDVDAYVQELTSSIPSDFRAKGDLYVFVDECHRTQSGKLHQAMKKFLPEAVFLGFTGTPLLKKDKQTSLEVFGPYIHTYKFDEAVADKVVLDLRYEARDVEQKLTSPQRIDEWFDLKTSGLTDVAKAELKQKWGTLKKVFSSKSRLEKIVMDIVLDMAKKERLQNGRGNALLISDSIYNACRYYDLFQQAGLKQCAIVTSFVPTHADIKGEETGEGYTEKLQRFEIYRNMLADYFHEDPDEAVKKVAQFEQEVKQKFIHEPAQMKLLIVVNKLLTGFDAPPATFLYIDKRMRDHGLFQAVCRVNRLDGDDKDYGYIIDYMDLFKSLEQAFDDYTSEAFDGYEPSDVAGLLQDRLKKGKERLDDALEAIKTLCEPVEPPKRDLDYVHYFCGDPQNPDLLKDTEPRRVALYKLTIALIRAYANIADEMREAGYTDQDTTRIKHEVTQFEHLRKQIQLASGDYVDLKQYEPAMRHLIDSYIGAEESRMLANFDDLSLVELLVQRGHDALDEIPERIRRDKELMAETIENNLRKVITEERPTNPAYYDTMSVLLDDVIALRKAATLEYEDYLQRIVQFSATLKKPDQAKAGYPASIDTNAKRALFDNLGRNEVLANALDQTIQATKKDGWRDNTMKTREVRYAIQDVLDAHHVKEMDAAYVLELVKNQREY